MTKCKCNAMNMAWGKSCIGCFSAQCSLAPARRQQFKEEVGLVCGVQSDFTSPFLHSGGVKCLEVRQGALIFLSAVLTVRCNPLMSNLAAEPNQKRGTSADSESPSYSSRDLNIFFLFSFFSVH